MIKHDFHDLIEFFFCGKVIHLNVFTIARMCVTLSHVSRRQPAAAAVPTGTTSGTGVNRNENSDVSSSGDDRW